MTGKFKTEVQPTRCKACGSCREVCPAGVFDRAGELNTSGYAYMVARHSEQCVGCLRCLVVCPDFAITVTPGLDERLKGTTP